MQLPPVLDFSNDPDGFDAHVSAEMAKPCQHCDALAPVVERPGQRNLFGGPRATQLHCTSCGERRAAFYPR